MCAFTKHYQISFIQSIKASSGFGSQAQEHSTPSTCEHVSSSTSVQECTANINAKSSLPFSKDLRIDEHVCDYSPITSETKSSISQTQATEVGMITEIEKVSKASPASLLSKTIANHERPDTTESNGRVDSANTPSTASPDSNNIESYRRADYDNNASRETPSPDSIESPEVSYPGIETTVKAEPQNSGRENHSGRGHRRRNSLCVSISEFNELAVMQDQHTLDTKMTECTETVVNMENQPVSLDQSKFSLCQKNIASPTDSGPDHYGSPATPDSDNIESPGKSNSSNIISIDKSELDKTGCTGSRDSDKSRTSARPDSDDIEPSNGSDSKHIESPEKLDLESARSTPIPDTENTVTLGNSDFPNTASPEDSYHIESPVIPNLDNSNAIEIQSSQHSEEIEFQGHVADIEDSSSSKQAKRAQRQYLKALYLKYVSLCEIERSRVEKKGKS